MPCGTARAFLVMWWFVQGAVAAGWIIALVLGAVLVAAGTISLGTAFLLFQYVLLIARPLEEVVHELETVQKANGAMVHVAELLAVEPKVLDAGDTSPPPGSLAIAVDDVHFDYGDDRPVLRDVTITIGAGRSVGIVGRTGSGKTTFSRLVLRLVEPTAGVVSLGGVPIVEIPLAELRRRVALVPQEVELFAGSVRDNVTLFDDEASDVDVLDTLHRVGLGPRSRQRDSTVRSARPAAVCRPAKRSCWPSPCVAARPRPPGPRRGDHGSTPRPSVVWKPRSSTSCGVARRW